ncbi:MAG: M23 family metallopeptidase [Rudaea sp.]
MLHRAISAPANWRHKHWALAGAVAASALMAGLALPGFAVAMRQTSASGPLTTLDLDVPQLSDEEVQGQPPAGSDEPDWQVVKVHSGQTLGNIFHEQGLSPNDLARLLDQQENAPALCHIHPGDEFAFQRSRSGALNALRFDRDDRTRVVVSFANKSLRETHIDRAVERRTHVAHGVIESSLFGAGEEAGMSDMMVLQLAEAFGYDIDFAQDLRVGDSFTVIYDDVYREGERLRDGNIIAATFINHGKRYSAFRYTNAEGDTKFYSEDGRPLRKTFLRTPVDFTRITSGFSVARMHPILGTMRAHKGVDYAAPMGTPIRAAGDGKIAFRGWQAGYGNVVVIQHNGHNSTLYGHMSRFAGEQVGQRIAQGATIGYVGMTGLATGPHLHYEFRIDGQHRDPLTVTMLPPEPLPGAELGRFRTETQPKLAKLKSLEATRLASAK